MSGVARLFMLLPEVIKALIEARCIVKMGTTIAVAAQNIIPADNISLDPSIQSNQGVQIGKRKTGVDDFALLLPYLTIKKWTNGGYTISCPTNLSNSMLAADSQKKGSRHQLQYSTGRPFGTGSSKPGRYAGLPGWGLGIELITLSCKKDPDSDIPKSKFRIDYSQKT
ncbi:hypothetical protein CDAR_319441 [Caerostris darwini]|uniref:Uncharacterized protein n=1 Tax=Caerostris darwini TaxID=1538125 RepID=A0AAV4V8M1_9ARAC|nr:hypothetical protein CDAR_319441 [Caerostris darwini]